MPTRRGVAVAAAPATKRSGIAATTKAACLRMLQTLFSKCCARVAPPLGERRDENLAVAGTVELAEEDSLPAAERELAVADRDEDLRAHERCANMGRRVRPVGGLGVLPPPLVVHELLESVLEILGNERVGVLVDRDTRRRVRHVDERSSGPVRVDERRLNQLRDVQELGL